MSESVNIERGYAHALARERAGGRAGGHARESTSESESKREYDVPTHTQTLLA